jgi:hypothetical protein
MSRLKATFTLLAFSVSFVPLAANARGPVAALNPPTLQLVQISGPTNASPFGAGRAADLPGYNSRMNGGAVIYTLTNTNAVQDASVSGSVRDN